MLLEIINIIHSRLHELHVTLHKSSHDLYKQYYYRVQINILFS